MYLHVCTYILNPFRKIAEIWVGLVFDSAKISNHSHWSEFHVVYEDVSGDSMSHLITLMLIQLGKTQKVFECKKLVALNVTVTQVQRSAIELQCFEEILTVNLKVISILSCVVRYRM